METAAIVTTRANHSLNGIHERMPVIVPPEAFNLWLDCANVDAETAAGLIAPASDDLLEAYEVSTAVNRTANDDPGLVERYTAPAETEPVTPVSTPRVPAKRAQKKDDGQGALF
jgi:putative SOS response-associated peptidase YedK